MYLTLSDVDICKAKEEGLKKLLKEYRFSIGESPKMSINVNDYWYNNKQMLKNKCDKNVNNWMFSEVDSDLKVVQGMAEQVKDVKVANPKSCQALSISTIRMYNTMPFLLYPSTPGEQASLPEKGTGGGCESFAGQPEQAGSSCHQPPQPPIKPAIKANLNNQVVLVNHHLNHQSTKPNLNKQLVLVQA